MLGKTVEPLSAVLALGILQSQAGAWWPAPSDYRGRAPGLPWPWLEDRTGRFPGVGH